MPVHHRLAAVAGTSLVALASLAGVSAAATNHPATAPTAAARRGQAASSTAAAALLAQKLEANQKYPYSQVTLAIPRLAIKGVSASESTLVDGLRIVTDTPKAVKGKPAAGKVDVLYKGTDLGELRVIGSNLYLLANVAKWDALPIKLKPATKQELAAIDTSFGERWFEISATTLSQMARSSGSSSAGVGGALGALQNPAGLQSSSEAALTGLLKGLTITKKPAAGGNVSFRASGSLQSLASSGAAAFSTIEKSLGIAGKSVTKVKAAKGSYTLVVTTAAHNAYVSSILLAIGVNGKGSMDLSIAYAHADEPVVAPAGAKVLTKQTLSQLGF